MLGRFQWTKVHVLYSTEPWAIGVYNKFKSIAEPAGIEIVNPEELRGISFEAGYKEMAEYSEAFSFIKNSNVVPILMFSYSHGPRTHLSGLYDNGVRKGDKVIIASAWLQPAVYEDAPPEFRPGIEQVLSGAIQFFAQSWVGDLGDHVMTSL
jgi:hypothetical protein